MKFDHKVVLITGGSRGIGRATALAFAKEGASVALNYRANTEAAEATLKQLEGKFHTLIQGDIGDAAAVKNVVDHVVKHYGQLDILVNNAGIFEQHPIDKVDYETWQKEWQRTININLLGAANMMYCVAQQMRQQEEGGRIINVSSRGAFRGEPLQAAYGASKAGMNAMGQSLAQALAPHKIFVGTVAPGFVKTEMAAASLKGRGGKAIKNQSPLGRVATPEEVAKGILFFAEEGTEFMTGAILDINGASYLRS